MVDPVAARDPAARDRFVAGLRRGAGVEEPPPVLSSKTSSGAVAWVAVADEELSGLAGAYLRPVEMTGGAGEAQGSAPGGGPRFRHYWQRQGTGIAAASAWRGWGPRASGGGAAARPDYRVVVMLLVLVVLLVVMLLLIYPLLAGLRPQPSATQESTPSPSESASEEQSSPEPEESASPTDEEVPEVEVDPGEVEELREEPGNDDPSSLG